MKKHLLKSLLALALVLISVDAWGDSYTITFLSNSGDGTTADTSTSCSTIVTEGSSAYLSGNLATATNVYYNGKSGLKLGKSSAGGTIKMILATSVTPTSIVVNCGRYNSSNAVTLKVNGSATQNVTADFSDLTFNITTEISYLQLESSKYCWIKSITVNYGDSEPNPVATPTFSKGSGLYLGTQSVTISCDTDGATLYYTTDGTAATTNSSVYSSAIQITSTTTVNVLAVKSGLTNATASATYTIIASPSVSAKGVNSNYYTKVTSLSDLENGDAVLIVSGSKAMGAQSTNNRSAVDVTVSGDVINAPDATVQKLILVVSDGYYFFYTGDDGYLYAPSSTNNNLKTENIPEANAAARITIDASGDATIVFQGDKTRNILRYNSSNTVFSCYASGQQAVVFYKEVTAPSQLPSAPAFNAEKVNAAKKVDGTFESVTFPTLSTAAGYNGTVSYASDNTSVATVNASTGAVTLAGAGTATITATTTETTSFTAGTASYEITVYQIVDGVFDFTLGNYLSLVEASTTQGTAESTWTAGDVQIAVAGRNCWYDGRYLGIYNTSGNDAAGSITVSVPSGKNITRIVATGTRTTNLKPNTGAMTTSTWTGFAPSVKFDFSGSNTIQIESLTVTYTDESSTIVNVSAYGYATASFTSQVVIPDAATATVYAVSGVQGDEVTLTALEAGKVLPANKGVIIYKENGGEVTFSYTNSSDLLSVTTKLSYYGTISTNDYILSVNENDKFGFCHPREAIECPAGKAFLRASNVPNNNAPFLRIGGTTRIANAEAEAETGEYYDLTGRKVEQPQRGIYIVGGKKVMVK